MCSNVVSRLLLHLYLYCIKCCIDRGKDSQLTCGAVEGLNQPSSLHCSSTKVIQLSWREIELHCGCRPCSARDDRKSGTRIPNAGYGLQCECSAASRRLVHGVYSMQYAAYSTITAYTDQQQHTAQYITSFTCLCMLLPKPFESRLKMLKFASLVDHTEVTMKMCRLGERIAGTLHSLFGNTDMGLVPHLNNSCPCSQVG